MIRFVVDQVKYEKSVKGVLISGVFLTIIGSVLTYSNFFNWNGIGIALLIIGIFVLVSLIVEKIKNRYSLKI